MEKKISPIAYIETEFKEKFGVPRQSGLAGGLRGKIVLEPEYRSREALRGLEGFSRIWLIWGFSEIKKYEFSPTVRPPRLGGNTRMGVFATRSPFRPNGLGLSCVELEGICEEGDKGHILEVKGADLVSGTPIYDIKPYVPYADSFPDAEGGFAAERPEATIEVKDPKGLSAKIPAEKREALMQVLSLDPRPAYSEDGERVYGMDFAGYNVRFSVEGNILNIKDIK